MRSLLLIALALIAGCQSPGITPEQIRIAEQFCAPYGGVQYVNGALAHTGLTRCNDGIIIKWYFREAN